MQTIESILQIAPVIPVLTIDDVNLAIPVAEALVAGGLPVLEVTLRTEAALDVIRAMQQVDGAIIGAGTVTTSDRMEKAIDAGSAFIVSPGLTSDLVNAATGSNIPLLPGIANASDIMRGMDMGLDHFKFFPAEANGGITALKALSAPFGEVKFCPTGGISQATASEWLALSSVVCVGGSWLVGSGMPVPAEIKARAIEASSLSG